MPYLFHLALCHPFDEFLALNVRIDWDDSTMNSDLHLLYSDGSDLMEFDLEVLVY